MITLLAVFRNLTSSRLPNRFRAVVSLFHQPTRLAGWLLGLLLLGLLPHTSFAQNELELASGSVSSTVVTGPTVTTPEAMTLLQNTTGTTFVPTTPPFSVSASLSNQVYTNIANAAGNGVSGSGTQFGTTLNNTAKFAAATLVYNKLNAIGGATNPMLTSNPYSTTGTGFDVASNYGFNLFTTIEPLASLSAVTAGRYYYGDITLTFNRPVAYPVLTFVGMGGFAGTTGNVQGFAAEFDFVSPTSLTRLSGSTEFTVTPTSGTTTIGNSASVITATSGSGGASGSVRVNGTNITSLTFKLFIRGDGKGTAWSNANRWNGDQYLLSASLGPPSTLSGNVFDDGNAGTINGTGTNAGGTLFANLVSSSGVVIATTPIAADGTYSFTNIYADTYTVVLSTTQGTVGSAPPAAALPTGWVNTGEGVGATPTTTDGTVNGIVTATIAGTSATGETLTNVNFGIEQLPTPTSSTLTAQGNPGGTVGVSIPPASFTGTDPDGTVAQIIYTAFPTNVTSLTIGASVYTSATFPAGGVTAVTGTAVRIDPVDGAVTAVIPFRAVDNAGFSSTATASVSVPFTTLTLSGTVFDDANGLTDNTVNGTATNTGSPLFAVLTDPVANTVIGSTAVAANGTYSFAGLNGGSYQVRLSTTAGTVGAAPPAASLPTGWTNTAEGTAAAGDGTVNGITNVTITNVNLTGVNFGIEQLPAPTSSTLASQGNPGGTVGVAVPPASFTGTDPDGTVARINYTAFPTNVNSLTIGGTVYTSATFPAGGVTAVTGTAVSIDPVDGAVTAVIPFKAIDNAGFSSTATGSVSVPFTTMSISGTVFNDANALTDNLVNGTATNAGGQLYAVLISGAGTVVASTSVASNGTYNFAGLLPGTYNVRLSTTTLTVGSVAPAATVPAGYTITGEGVGTTPDGLTDGNNIVVLGVTNITNINFGIEQLPAPTSSTLTAQVNPGGTIGVAVPPASFTGTDPDGTVTRILYTAFPTNVTSLTIGGTTYTSATFPAGGVTAVTGTAVSIDPIDGAVTAVIPFKAIDNAGFSSTATGSVSVPFTTLTLSGTVFDDANGLTDNTVNGTGTNAGGTLFAVLTDPVANTVIGSTAVAANGTYSFANLNGGSYQVRLSTTAGTVGATPPAASLPAGWVNTAEGTATAGDGTVNGITAVTLTTANVTGVNFGIEQLPAPTSSTLTAQANPGGTIGVAIPPASFTGTDPDGTVAQIIYTAFPSNVNSLTIGGTTYTSATFPAGGVTAVTGTAVSIDPIDGAVTAVIPFRAVDNAGFSSTATGSVSVPFTTLTLSGTVFDDANGLTDNTVNGTGTNAGGTLFAVLTDPVANTVIGSTAVAANGTYSFANLNGGSYQVRLSTTAGTVGATPPAASLPAGWVNTAEGTATAGDGTVNGITAVTLTTANVTGVNFGIEQLPAPTSSTLTAQANPGGTIGVAIPPASFTGTDPDGTVAQIIYTAFPTNVNSLTIGGTVYTSATFPAGGVTAVTGTAVSIDPIDGAVTAVIPFRAVDNAGFSSTATGSVSVPFTTLTLSGTVFDDANGLTDNTVNGTATNAGGTLFAVLTDPVANTVIGSVAVAANGTYSFAGLNGGNYSVVLSTTAGTVGATPPAASLPAGWVNTAEGTATAGDGTVNGITSVTLTTANVTGVNFGIEQLPAPTSSTLTAQTNPGGTIGVAIPPASFTGTDPDGTVAQIIYTAFPTNVTSLTIGGTAYTSATFPAGGVTAVTGTTVSIDPINGAVTAVIPFRAVDNAGFSSTATGSVSVPFTTLTLSGTVFDDANGLTDNTVNGTGTNAGGTLFAVLTDPVANTVIGSTAVAANGTYSFANLNGGSYQVRLSTTAGTIGATPPAASLPAGWVNTGEGTATAGDGTVNGITAVTLTTANVTGVNFGIEQLPAPTSSTLTAQANPGGTLAVAIPPASFTGTDPDGTVAQIIYTAFPSNVTSLTIGGTVYTSATFPAGGVTAVTGTAVSIDPIDGAVTAVIPFRAVDNAGFSSTATGSVSVPFTTLTLSGTVFDDANGLTDNTVNGTGTNAGGTLFAVLTDPVANTVIGSTAVAANGTYSFANLNGGSYQVRLSTTAGTIGAAAPAASLPAGWVNTGEGTATAGDGTVNGITAVTLTTANVTGVNFGIEQLPAPTSSTLTAQTNPGGTIGVSIPPASFTGTDPDGTVAQIIYTAFPTNVTSLTIGGTAYTSATFPAGGVTAVTGTAVSIDPVDGAVTAVIPFRAVDNAGFSSTATGSVSVPFTTLTLSGTVFDDANGLTDNTVNGTGTNAGGTLFAVLTDPVANTVIGSVAVAANGTYSFAGLNGGSYQVRLSTTAGTTGATPPAASLPTGWVNTGEGTATAGDGTVNGITSVTLTTANVTGVNFGIEQLPTPTSTTVVARANPGGTNSLVVPPASLTGTDPDGTVTQIRYTAFPSNLTSITIGTTLYTSATFPNGGVTVSSTTPVHVDPIDGVVTAVIPFRVIDNAGFESLTTATATVPFTCTVPLCPPVTGRKIQTR
ncbi:hypothetical protein [Spirosoma luteolum]